MRWPWQKKTVEPVKLGLFGIEFPMLIEGITQERFACATIIAVAVKVERACQEQSTEVLDSSLAEEYAEFEYVRGMFADTHAKAKEEATEVYVKSVLAQVQADPLCQKWLVKRLKGE